MGRWLAVTIGFGVTFIGAIAVLMYGPEKYASCQVVGFPNDAYQAAMNFTIGYNHIDGPSGALGCQVPADLTWWASFAVLLVGLTLTLRHARRAPRREGLASTT